MTIGERIKQRRLELGLTQTELANRLGNKSRVSVCTVEKDKEDLTIERIKKYAKALEVSPTYLMGFEKNTYTPSNAEFEITLTDENGQTCIVSTDYNIPQRVDSTILQRLTKYLDLVFLNENIQKLLDEASDSESDDILLATDLLSRLRKGRISNESGETK